MTSKMLIATLCLLCIFSTTMGCLGGSDDNDTTTQKEVTYPMDLDKYAVSDERVAFKVTESSSSYDIQTLDFKMTWDKDVYEYSMDSAVQHASGPPVQYVMFSHTQVSIWVWDMDGDNQLNANDVIECDRWADWDEPHRTGKITIEVIYGGEVVGYGTGSV